MTLIISIWIALILDRLMGDPRWLPHPVKLIGSLALRLEMPMRRYFSSEKTAGVITAAIVISATVLIVAALLWMAGLIAPWLGRVVAVVTVI